MTFPEIVKTVFISATQQSSKINNTIIHTLAIGKYIPIWMEHNIAKQQPVLENSLENISNSDIFILVLDESGGYIFDDSEFFIEKEYNHAKKIGKPIVVLLKQGIKNRQNKTEYNNFVNRVTHNKNGELALQYTETDLEKMTAALMQSLNDLEIASSGGYIRRKKYIEFGGKLSRMQLQRDRDRLHREAIWRALKTYMSAMYKRIEHMQSESQLKGVVMKYETELHQIIEGLVKQWGDHPVLIELIEDSLERLSDIFHSIDSKEGYKPLNIEDLQRICKKLYQVNRLKHLDAVSVISKKPNLKSYQQYWSHPALGTEFHNLNLSFLENAQSGCALRRFYICDSLHNSIANCDGWLINSALKLAHYENAEIKIIDLEFLKDRTIIADFGIYTHEDNGISSGEYLLLAPEKIDDVTDMLDTQLIVDPDLIAQNKAQFNSLWNHSEAFSSIKKINKNLPVTAKQTYGTMKPNDIFEEDICFRNNVCLNPNRSSITFHDENDFQIPNDTIRKTDTNYSKGILEFFKREFSFSAILCIRDSLGTDDRFVRNIQKHTNQEVFGFICDPQMIIEPSYINNVLYADDWRHLSTLAILISEQDIQFEDLLIITELDETLWAPRDRFDRKNPLASTRLDAILGVLKTYLGYVDDLDPKNMIKVVKFIYQKTGESKYNSFIKDNEEYRALLTIAISLSVFPENKVTSKVHKGTQSSDALNPHMLITQEFDNTDFIEWQIESIINRYKDLGFKEFLFKVYFYIAQSHGKANLITKGLNANDIGSDWGEMMELVNFDKNTAFLNFRHEEFNRTMQLLTGDDQTHKLVMNKYLIDFLVKIKNAGGNIFGVSDRPDEASYNKQHTLLNTDFVVYGHALGPDQDHIFNNKS